MAEMTTLVAALYRTYSTTIKQGYEGVSPGVTSRFEVFSDENFTEIKVSIVQSAFHDTGSEVNVGISRNMVTAMSAGNCTTNLIVVWASYKLIGLQCAIRPNVCFPDSSCGERHETLSHRTYNS